MSDATKPDEPATKPDEPAIEPASTYSLPLDTGQFTAEGGRARLLYDCDNDAHNEERRGESGQLKL